MRIVLTSGLCRRWVACIRALMLAALICPRPVLAQAPEFPVVPPGAQWRLLDNGSDQGAAWRSNTFNDLEWLIGVGPFGYGEGDERTPVNPGPNAQPYVTTYFRHVFPGPSLSPEMILELRIQRDDGAVAYLNGAEIWRDNLPPTSRIRHNTRALQPVPDDGQVYFTVPVDPSLLSLGLNVLAVEIHQATNDGPPDMSFDAALFAVPGFPPFIQQHPQCLTAFLGTNVQFFAFAVGATQVQWLHNDVAIPGATNAVLTLTNLPREHAGQYRLVASNFSGTALSEAGELQLELDTDGVIRYELVARDHLSLSGFGPAAFLVAAAGPAGCQPPIFSMSHGSSYSYSTHGGTTAPGETNHCGVVGGHSKWSIFTASITERVIIRTEGSGFDTVLAVYTWDGNDLHPLVLVVCDNDSGPNGTSRVEFLAVAGTTYYIAVDGVNGATGNVRLQIGGLELGTPNVLARSLVNVTMIGRRAQDRTYTLYCATNPAAASNAWGTVLTTNVSRTVPHWFFSYVTNPPAGTPKLFFIGKERP